jgi:FKBP-type peptidyl-prolyl cis-trans isomerase 2
MIEDGKQVSIEYTLTLTDGTEVDSNVGGEPLVYTQGGGQILPALESALAELEPDSSRRVALDATDGYGDVDPDLFREVETNIVPEEARQVGAMLMAGGEEGPRHPVRVHEVKNEVIVLDFNHPLAGQDLIFEVKVTAVD